MITGDEWKTGEANAPTPEDMVKYASQKNLLLMSLPYYGHLTIQEVRIYRTANDGEYFQTYGSGFLSGSWYQTSETRLLAIIPPLPTPEKKPQPNLSVDKGVNRKPKPRARRKKKKCNLW